MWCRRLWCVGILAIISYVGVEFLVLPLFNPLRRSNESIAQSMLQKTPLGTSRNDVLAVITQELRSSDQFAILFPKSIMLRLGSFDTGLLTMYVSIFFIFDDKGKLIEVYAEKHTPEAL